MRQPPTQNKGGRVPGPRQQQRRRITLPNIPTRPTRLDGRPVTGSPTSVNAHQRFASEMAKQRMGEKTPQGKQVMQTLNPGSYNRTHKHGKPTKRYY